MKQNNAGRCFMMWELASKVPRKGRKKQNTSTNQVTRLYAHTDIQKNPLSWVWSKSALQSNPVILAVFMGHSTQQWTCQSN
jgi:hypothetical protein